MKAILTASESYQELVAFLGDCASVSWASLFDLRFVALRFGLLSRASSFHLWYAETPPTIPQPTRKHVLVSSIPGTEAVPKPPAPAAARRTRLAPASGGQRRGVGGARGASRGRSIRRSGFDEFASDLEDESSASDGEEFEMELALASDGEDEFAATASGAVGNKTLQETCHGTPWLETSLSRRSLH